MHSSFHVQNVNKTKKRMQCASLILVDVGQKQDHMHRKEHVYIHRLLQSNAFLQLQGILKDALFDTH